MATRVKPLTGKSPSKGPTARKTSSGGNPSIYDAAKKIKKNKQAKKKQLEELDK